LAAIGYLIYAKFFIECKYYTFNLTRIGTRVKRSTLDSVRVWRDFAGDHSEKAPVLCRALRGELQGHHEQSGGGSLLDYCEMGQDGYNEHSKLPQHNLPPRQLSGFALPLDMV